MSGSSGPSVADHKPSLLVSETDPPGHSPETFTSFAFGARSRNVAVPSAFTSGETSAAESRLGAAFVWATVEVGSVATAVAKRTSRAKAGVVFIAVEGIKPAAQNNSTA